MAKHVKEFYFDLCTIYEIFSNFTKWDGFPYMLSE